MGEFEWRGRLRVPILILVQIRFFSENLHLRSDGNRCCLWYLLMCCGGPGVRRCLMCMCVCVCVLRVLVRAWAYVCDAGRPTTQRRKVIDKFTFPSLSLSIPSPSLASRVSLSISLPPSSFVMATAFMSRYSSYPSSGLFEALEPHSSASISSPSLSPASGSPPSSPSVSPLMIHSPAPLGFAASGFQQHQQHLFQQQQQPQQHYQQQQQQPANTTGDGSPPTAAPSRPAITLAALCERLRQRHLSQPSVQISFGHRYVRTSAVLACGSPHGSLYKALILCVHNSSNSRVELDIQAVPILPTAIAMAPKKPGAGPRRARSQQHQQQQQHTFSRSSSTSTSSASVDLPPAPAAFIVKPHDESAADSHQADAGLGGKPAGLAPQLVMPVRELLAREQDTSLPSALATWASPSTVLLSPPPKYASSTASLHGASAGSASLQFRALGAHEAPQPLAYHAVLEPYQTTHIEMIVVHRSSQHNTFCLSVVLNGIVVDQWPCRLYHASYGMFREDAPLHRIETVVYRASGTKVLERWDSNASILSAVYRASPTLPLRW